MARPCFLATLRERRGNEDLSTNVKRRFFFHKQIAQVFSLSSRQAEDSDLVNMLIDSY
jgi:hypothetical protein